MASARLRRGARGWTVSAAVVMSVAASSAAAGQEAERAAVTHLRPTSRQAAGYIEAGKIRSATFRQLVAGIEQSDLAVYVQVLPVGSAGQLQFVAAAGGVRYLWITVRSQATDDDVLPLLAHELSHAMEIARAPDVHDAASLLRYYERIGWSSRSVVSACLESANAQRTQQLVARELRRKATTAARMKTDH